MQSFSEDHSFEELKTLYMDGIYKTQALLIRDKPITLQSGKKSHIYLNHRHFLSNSVYLSLIAKIYSKLVRSGEDEVILGAVDSLTSPVIVGAMSVQMDLDYVVIRRAPMTHGTQEYIYGKLTRPVILIDDMTSTGETLLDAAEKVRLQGGVVTTAIISAYREETAIQNLKDKGIELRSIASFAEIIATLLPVLSDHERAIIQTHPLIF